MLHLYACTGYESSIRMWRTINLKIPALSISREIASDYDAVRASAGNDKR